MAVPRLTISDASIERFHPDFWAATVKDSSKRAPEGKTETQDKVRVVVYDVQSRMVGILYKSVSDEYELVGGARAERKGKLERPQAAALRELREEMGLAGKRHVLALRRLCVYQETRERLGLAIRGTCYLAVVDRSTQAKTPKLSAREREAGLSTLWLPMNEAMALIASQEHDSYTALFEQYRNMVLLGEAIRYISSTNIR